MADATAQLLYDLIWQTRRLFQRLRATSDQLLENSGINSSQRAVLEFLCQAQPQSVPRMARARSVSRQHVQVVINQLNELQLVEAVHNPSHKRSPLFQLTENGKVLFNAIHEKELAFLSRIELEFTSHDLVTSITTLKRIDQYLSTDLGLTGSEDTP
jgi:DNA-binding MarR family transcriptional regulator